VKRGGVGEGEGRGGGVVHLVDVYNINCLLQHEECYCIYLDP